LLIALVILIVGVVLLPLGLASLGSATTLPVITVPPEYYLKGWPGLPLPGFEQFVNTQGGALLSMLIVLSIGYLAFRASKGWTQEVPGRLQGIVEVLVDGLWGLAKSQAGNRPKVKYILFPIVASIFVYLLAGNLGKLLPGVETVGVTHCALYEPVAFNGHPLNQTGIAGFTYFTLRVDQALTVGTPGTSKSYKQCETFIGAAHHYPDYIVTKLDPFLDKKVTHVTAEGDTLASIAAQYTSTAADNATGELPTFSYFTTHYEGWKEVSFTPESVVLENLNGAATSLQFAPHDEEEVHKVATEVVVGETAVTLDLPEDYANAPLAAGQTVVVRKELFGEKATTPLNQLYTVAPFVRGLATDLNVTLGLAIMSFFLIQAFGISELGAGYFQKFINLRGLGKGGLGVIDFVAGLFEIVSEFGKIISLSFRLFGAIFAGTILFAVFMFLFGTLLPSVILILEFIVGTAQAGVFAILTLIFCAQAMVSHHHEDGEHGHDDAH
jgi:F0F1-type ATP synthase membrane subunit a